MSLFLKDWTVLIPIATLTVIAVGLAHGILASTRSQPRLEMDELPEGLKDNARPKTQPEPEQEEHAAPR